MTLLATPATSSATRAQALPGALFDCPSGYVPACYVDCCAAGESVLHVNAIDDAIADFVQLAEHVYVLPPEGEICLLQPGFGIALCRQPRHLPCRVAASKKGSP